MEYSKLAEFNDVALYNLKRLYYQDSVNSIWQKERSLINY
jgi:hypothetical protein